MASTMTKDPTKGLDGAVVDGRSTCALDSDVSEKEFPPLGKANGNDTAAAHQPQAEHKSALLVDKKLSPWLLAEVLVACLPACADGFNTGVINNSVIGVFTYFRQQGAPITKDDWSSFVSIFLIGAMVGSVFTGPLSKRFGPKRVMTFNNSLYFVSAIFFFTCKSFTILCVARLVAGLAMGINMPALQILVQECSPAGLRGLMMMLVLLSLTGSMVAGFSLGMSGVMGTPDLWHYLYGLPIVPTAVHAVVSWFVPESPRWLLSKAREEECGQALRKLRHHTVDIGKELEMIKESMASDEQSMMAAAKLLFTTKRFLWPMIIGNFLPVVVQFSCGSFVGYYSRVLFQELGFENGELATVFIGVVSMFSMFLAGALVERLGRRGILIYGWAATAVLAALFAIASIKSKDPGWNKAGLRLILVYSLIGGAPASIAMMLAPELFPNNVRSVAVGVCSLTARAMSFVVAKTFLNIVDALGNYLFFLFAATAVVGIFFVLLFVPETSGVPLEEIEQLFERKIQIGKRKKPRLSTATKETFQSENC